MADFAETPKVTSVQSIDEVPLIRDSGVAYRADINQIAATIGALLQGVVRDIYPNSAQTNVPRGMVGTGSITGGSGGTTGTFDVIFTGGNFSVNPKATFTVSAGAVTAVTVTSKGEYIGASPTAPTISFANSAGLTGASATVTVGFLINDGEKYLTLSSDGLQFVQYRNLSGVATAVTPTISIPSTGYVTALGTSVSFVPCTPGGTANAITLVPFAGYSVNGDKLYMFLGQGPNNSSGVTISIPGLNGGAATQLLLPSGEALPASTLNVNKTIIVRFITATAKFELVHPVYQPYPARIRLIQTGGTGRSPIFAMENPGTKVRADLTGCIFEAKLTGRKDFGSAGFTITGSVSATLTCLDTDGVSVIPENAWLEGDTIEFERPTAASQFKLVKKADNITGNLAKMSRALMDDLPTKNKQVIIHKTADGWFKCIAEAVQYDKKRNKMRQDNIEVLIEDLGPAMSLGVLKNTNAFAINSILANIGGKKYSYSAFSSDDTGAGSTAGPTRSTFEPVERFGLMSDTDLNATYGLNDPKHAIAGLSHVQIRADNVTLKVDGDATDYKSAPVGWRKWAAGVTITQIFSAYRPSVNSPTKCGLMEYITRIDEQGITLSYTAKIGRSLSYTGGIVKPVEGAIVYGDSSGATATIVAVPDSDVTGTWSGTAAGTLFVGQVTGTFTAGETVKLQGVGTSLFVAGGAAGPQISSQNTYVMMPTMTVDMAKPAGLTAVYLGTENGTQQPITQGLNFHGGSLEPTLGAYIYGETSGASASVWNKPASGSFLASSSASAPYPAYPDLPAITASGSWGSGNRAGRLVIANTTGQFLANENLLLEDGTVFAIADGSQSKVSSADGGVAGTWAPGASRVQFWHNTQPDIILEAILLDPDTSAEVAAPYFPPGDFGAATTSKISIQDRTEYVRKLYFNMRSGAAVSLCEGKYRSKIRYRYRRGAVI